MLQKMHGWEPAAGKGKLHGKAHIKPQTVITSKSLLHRKKITRKSIFRCKTGKKKSSFSVLIKSIPTALTWDTLCELVTGFQKGARKSSHTRLCIDKRQFPQTLTQSLEICLFPVQAGSSFKSDLLIRDQLLKNPRKPTQKRVTASWSISLASRKVSPREDDFFRRQNSEI